MSELHYSQVDYKIAPEDSLSIIGSNSINTSGDLYIININAIDKIYNKRNKRFLDIITSLLLFGIFPVGIFIIKSSFGYFKNIFLVLFGKKTIVGYYHYDDVSIDKLPEIKKGILNPTDAFRTRKINKDTIEKLNLIYARDYKIYNDLNIIFRGFKNLGRK
jgi:hypothetical protein